jgi:hypothetical protein
MTEEELVRTRIANASGAPLWEVSLVQHLGSQQLVLLVHHSIMDGEAAALLLQEVVKTMDALAHAHSDNDESALGALVGGEGVEPRPLGVAQDDLLEELGAGKGFNLEFRHAWRRIRWSVSQSVPVNPSPDRTACQKPLIDHMMRPPFSTRSLA